MLLSRTPRIAAAYSIVLQCSIYIFRQLLSGSIPVPLRKCEPRKFECPKPGCQESKFFKDNVCAIYQLPK